MDADRDAYGIEKKWRQITLIGCSETETFKWLFEVLYCHPGESDSEI